MRLNFKYIFLILLSFVWLEDSIFKTYDVHNSSNKTFYNKAGDSRVNLINSDINVTKLKFELNGYSFEEVENDFYKVNIDKGSPILIKGSPNLPKLNTSIIIPDNKQMSIYIRDSKYIEIDDINIIPSKGNFSRDIDPSTVPYEFSEVYEQDSFYPQKIAQLGEPYILRGLRGQGIIVNPIQYNPVSKTLRVYTSIEVVIRESKYEKIKNIKNSIVREKNIINVSNEFQNIHENLFINFQNDTRFEYLSDQGNMLIICYDDFIDQMEPFVQWKNKKGIYTEIIPVSSIGNSVTQIQSYINNYYYEKGLTYLLLVGDSNQIPTHLVSGSGSDPSYGFIEGEDSYSEIIVGRFSANNPFQVETQVRRTLEYEMNPVEINHFNKALGIASTQGPGYGGLSDDQFNELLWNDFLNDFTYENYEGIYDSNGSVLMGVDAINDGVGLINYTGHAGPNGWGNGAALSSTDVNNLINKDKLPFIFTVGCNPGQFNDITECFCESWMWATDNDGNPTGAVGHLGSTISQSWEPPMHGQWAMNAILTESFNNNISRSFGGIAVNGCMHMNEAQGSSGINETNHWTLFGDPSLMIRTDTPSVLNVNHDNSIIVGQSEFSVEVESGSLVALSVNGELKAHSYSIGGIAVLDLLDISNNPGDVNLVVSSFNKYPYESLIQVITTDDAYLVYDNYEVVSDSNFNDMIEYNDEISINLVVENVGVYNTNAINVSVSTEDPYISMIDSQSMIAYAIAGETATTEDPISFAIAANVPDRHSASFQAQLNNGDDSWNISFNILIHAPVFEIANPTIVDENEDGIWDPGELATIYADLINSGSAPFYMYPGAVISTDSRYVEVLSNDVSNTFYGIDPSTTYEGVFQLKASENTPLSTEIDFEFSWGYSSTSPCDTGFCVEQANLDYSTMIGHPSILIWDPSPQNISGNRLVEYFNENNITGYDYINNQTLISIDNYKTAFIFLGVYYNNHVLSDNEANQFVELLNNGGSVYLEGADTWYYDSQTSLHGMFGLSSDTDGSGDLSTISGVNDTFTQGMSFSYNGDNSYIDRLIPTQGFAILNNDSPSYTTAVAYENQILGYRTIGASHDLGGLQGEQFTDYINGVIDYLSGSGGGIEPECTIGDINVNGAIDVSDIVAIVNIVLADGSNLSESEICAADINIDNTIDVLDVIALVNIILDSNNRSKERLDPIDYADIVIEGNFLNLSIPGVVKGIELKIESNENQLTFNKGLNMDVSSTYKNKTHHILIYGLNGQYLDEGEYELLVFENSFTLLDVIVANSNNESVTVNVIQNVIPNSISLKQNYPNPFNPSTSIEFELDQSDNIKLIIYDINGRYIKTLADKYFSNGSHKFIWNSNDDYGNKVSSGVYIYQLISSEEIISNKMILLK